MSSPARSLRIVVSRERPLYGLKVGDIVRTGDNRYPHYKVIAICSDRAWIRDVRYGDDHVVPMDRLHAVL